MCVTRERERKGAFEVNENGYHYSQTGTQILRQTDDLTDRQ